MGIESPLRPYANSYLGSSELSLEETVLAYTTFPGGGTRPLRPYIIERIDESDGQIVFEQTPERKKVISDSTAWQIHSLLSDVLSRGTGSSAMSEYGLAVAGAAGKTGTAYNFTDTWFIGYSEAVTCGVWIGFDRPRQIYRGAFSKDLALPVWVDVMNASREDFPSAPMKAPVSVEMVKVCRVSGQQATDKCVERTPVPGGGDVTESTAYEEYVKVGAGPTTQCPIHSSGLKNYLKEFAEEEWPRAEVAIDLTKIRPVDVSSSPVVGGVDPYEAVSPGAFAAEGDVPVARAEAVGAATPKGEGETVAAGNSEVRQAEPVGIKESLEMESPGIVVPEPQAIQF
jgi:penicillin-binding protein 1A